MLFVQLVPQVNHRHWHHDDHHQCEESVPQQDEVGWPHVDDQTEGESSNGQVVEYCDVGGYENRQLYEVECVFYFGKVLTVYGIEVKLGRLEQELAVGNILQVQTEELADYILVVVDLDRRGLFNGDFVLQVVEENYPNQVHRQV